MSQHWHFDSGLSSLDRLILLANTPLLHVAATALPRAGLKTKPCDVSTEGLLLLGLASVLYGSDRKADAELRAQWSLLRPAVRAAGIELPVMPASVAKFRYWRDNYIDQDALEVLKEVLAEVFVGMALEMGLFPDSNDGWLTPSPLNMLMADGTWIEPASSVGHRRTGSKKPRKSRATVGSPRIVLDADRRGRASGYCTTVLFARGPGRRQQIFFSADAAPNGNEMEPVIARLTDLQRRLGGKVRAFAYDGAMVGVHQSRIRRLGIVPINKPKGIRKIEQWRRFQGARVSPKQIMELRLECGHNHRINVAAGMFWNVGTDAHNHPIRETVIEHVDCRRYETPADGYRFELDLRVPCPLGPDHIFTIDPSEKLKLGKRQVNLAHRARMIPLNDPVFRTAYGLRNSTEAGFAFLKNHLNLGNRAKSFTRVRFELDLLLLLMTTNSANWVEHRKPGLRLT